MTPPPRSFFLRSAEEVARDLLAFGLEVGKGPSRALVRLTEVEAYLGSEDPASHAYHGPTPRNGTMFEAGGTCYVYLSYGVHFCMNVVTGPKGLGQAVLLRAGEPLEGIDAMIRRRGLGKLPRARALKLLVSGPGRLTQALGVDLGYNGLIFGEPGFRLVRLEKRPSSRDVAALPRVGITKAREAPLRFCLKSSPWLSRRVAI